jgi:hypothetical protein
LKERNYHADHRQSAAAVKITNKVLHLVVVPDIGRRLDVGVSSALGTFMASYDRAHHEVCLGQFGADASAARWTAMQNASSEAARSILTNTEVAMGSRPLLQNAVHAIVSKVHGKETYNVDGSQIIVEDIVTTGAREYVVKDTTKRPRQIVAYIVLPEIDSAESLRAAEEAAAAFKPFSAVYDLTVKIVFAPAADGGIAPSEKEVQALIRIKSSMQAYSLHWERSYCNVASVSEPISDIFTQVHAEVSARCRRDAGSPATTLVRVPHAYGIRRVVWCARGCSRTLMVATEQ